MNIHIYQLLFIAYLLRQGDEIQKQPDNKRKIRRINVRERERERMCLYVCMRGECNNFVSIMLSKLIIEILFRINNDEDDDVD